MTHSLDCHSQNVCSNINRKLIQDGANTGQSFIIESHRKN